MDENTTIRPVRAPERARPGRRRRHERPGPPYLAHRIARDTTAHAGTPATEQHKPEMQGGGGSSGRGPGDDDGGRKPDRDGNDAVRFLIALGIVAVGAGVMGARLLAKGSRAPHVF